MKTATRGGSSPMTKVQWAESHGWYVDPEGRIVDPTPPYPFIAYTAEYGTQDDSETGEQIGVFRIGLPYVEPIRIEPDEPAVGPCSSETGDHHWDDGGTTGHAECINCYERRIDDVSDR